MASGESARRASFVSYTKCGSKTRARARTHRERGREGERQREAQRQRQRPRGREGERESDGGRERDLLAVLQVPPLIHHPPPTTVRLPPRRRVSPPHKAAGVAVLRQQMDLPEPERDAGPAGQPATVQEEHRGVLRRFGRRRRRGGDGCCEAGAEERGDHCTRHRTMGGAGSYVPAAHNAQRRRHSPRQCATPPCSIARALASVLRPSRARWHNLEDDAHVCPPPCSQTGVRK